MYKLNFFAFFLNLNIVHCEIKVLQLTSDLNFSLFLLCSLWVISIFWFLGRFQWLGGRSDHLFNHFITTCMCVLFLPNCQWLKCITSIVVFLLAGVPWGHTNISVGVYQIVISLLSHYTVSSNESWILIDWLVADSFMNSQYSWKNLDLAVTVVVVDNHLGEFWMNHISYLTAFMPLLARLGIWSEWRFC